MTSREHGQMIQDYFEQVLLMETDECIVWPFSIRKNKYGVIYIDGVQEGVHREICRRKHGDPPTYLHEAAHSCDNRPCVNWRHLSWRTHKENIATRRYFECKDPQCKRASNDSGYCFYHQFV